MLNWLNKRTAIFRKKPIFRVLSGQKYFFLTLFIIAILPILVSTNVLFILRSNAHWFDNPDAIIYVLFFGISIFTMGLALTPTTFVAIISGHFWGWIGLPGVVISYGLAAILGFLAGKGLNTVLPEKQIIDLPELQPFKKNIKKNELYMIILGRLSPVLPFAMMNFALAAFKPSFLKFMFGSIVGMFPRTLVFFIAGMQAANIWAFLTNPSLRGGLEIVPIALIIISSFGILHFIVKISRIK